MQNHETSEGDKNMTAELWQVFDIHDMWYKTQ